MGFAFDLGNDPGAFRWAMAELNFGHGRLSFPRVEKASLGIRV
jgi:hypothetical protein